MRRSIELLAPAASLEVGRVALSAGADALYVGAPKFGARSSAGVSVGEIATLAREAHAVGARVYVALNTILTDAELSEAVAIARALYDAGADALIVQDMGLVMADLPPMPLHASTQCHTVRWETMRLWEALGMEQVVLARELGVADLPRMIEGVDVRAECFVHGALCVSYSGRCFISEACHPGRSANRGACAQWCRMRYDLEDAEGRKLVTGKYLLSLKDLNRTELLEPMLDAGVTSLKIEGRLKGEDYVRNVTAHYRRALDAIIARRSDDFARSSWGEVETAFEARPEQTFSRLFTAYDTPLHRPIPVESITPFTNKSIGERIGTLTECHGREVVIRLEGATEPVNGDGLLFVSADEEETAGALVNGVTPLGKGVCRLRLSAPVEVAAGGAVYRNLNHRLDRLLHRPDASTRRVAIEMECRADRDGVRLTARIAEQPAIEVQVERKLPLEPARKDGTGRLRECLTKLGETPYVAAEVMIDVGGFFVPLSVATELRRELAEALAESCHRRLVGERDERGEALRAKRIAFLSREHRPEEYGLPKRLDFSYNVANRSAEALYQRLGVTGTIEAALEVKRPAGSLPVMQTRHCLLHHIGCCRREDGGKKLAEPLYLVRGGRRFRIETDCSACRMTLLLEDASAD